MGLIIWRYFGAGENGSHFAPKMRCNKLIYSAFQNFVELAGVEPASKRGSHMVSTCLSLTWFSDAGWIRATDLQLISLFSPADRSIPQTILQLLRHLIRTAESVTSGVTSRPGTLYRD